MTHNPTPAHIPMTHVHQWHPSHCILFSNLPSSDLTSVASDTLPHTSDTCLPLRLPHFPPTPSQSIGPFGFPPFASKSIYIKFNMATYPSSQIGLAGSQHPPIADFSVIKVRHVRPYCSDQGSNLCHHPLDWEAQSPNHWTSRGVWHRPFNFWHPVASDSNSTPKDEATVTITRTTFRDPILWPHSPFCPK